MVATYTITDADGLTATAAVRLTVDPPLNRAPVAADDRAEVVEGDSVTIDVLRNDRDPDNDPLTLSLLGDGDGSLRRRLGAGFDHVPGRARGDRHGRDRLPGE